jgi:predicted Zn-dependent protease
MTMLGEKVVDERITISADPLDPDLGFAPFSILEGVMGGDMFDQSVYHPATWITRGVLTNLAYDRRWAIARLGKNEGLPNSGAFRMSGGDTSMEEMIETTKRGVLVTRFVNIVELDFQSQLYRGYTRDGLWLIENGKISKPVKNMAFTESILFALNNILQLGKPQRIYNPNVALKNAIPQPTVVPTLKIREFSFTALSDAI